MWLIASKLLSFWRITERSITRFRSRRCVISWRISPTPHRRLKAITTAREGSSILARRSRPPPSRSEEHTSELQSLMRISYAVFCLKKKKITHPQHIIHTAVHKAKYKHE